jgi:hypothetical protein
MTQEAEIEELKASVSCAAVLERLPPVWLLDRRESTRRSLKYRRGAGEIVIVNHDGRGWWDPLSDAKGDIFTLVRHLDPGLNFTEARRVLRDFAGIAPCFWRLSARNGAAHPVFRLSSGGSVASLCRADRQPGATSPNSADCRRRSCWPRARWTPSAKAHAAAPGSRIGMAQDC